MRDGKIRFTDRVVDFLKYRPSYPNDVVELIQQQFESPQNVPVADVGAGTGIFTRQLLSAGFEVFGVEPNHAMRQAAENNLADFRTFRCVTGSAEETGMPDRQVEFVTAAQAFHWFDLELTKAEFVRITRPPHRVMLVWNYRHPHLGEFNEAYEDFLLQWCEDYAGIREIYLDEHRIERFFGDSNNFNRTVFKNRQLLNWESLQGRVKSCSYAPGENDPRSIPMTCDLRQRFDQHEQNGFVELRYETNAFLGEIAFGSERF